LTFMKINNKLGAYSFGRTGTFQLLSLVLVVAFLLLILPQVPAQPVPASCFIYNAYLSFDTSSVSGTISSVQLGLKTKIDYSNTDFNLMVYHGTCMGNDSLDAGDWNACVNGGTYDGNLMNTASWPGNFVFATMSIPTTAVNTDGNTQFELTSSRYIAKILATGPEYVIFYSANSADANAPYLQITTIDPSNPPDINTLSFSTDQNYYLKGGSTFLLDWNASDTDTNADAELFDLNYNGSQALGGTVILEDGNVASTANLWCDSNNLSSVQACHYLWTVPSLDANYYFIANISDPESNNDWNASIRQFAIDSTSPSTTYSGCDNQWNSSNQTITLSCSDSSSCSSTIYRTDSGSWASYSATFQITTDGNHQIDYNSTDLVGNIETTKTSYCAVDKTAPSISEDNGI